MWRKLDLVAELTQCALFRLQNQNDKIMAAHRTVAETEDVAMEITSELARNREKIESSHNKVNVYYFDWY